MARWLIKSKTANIPEIAEKLGISEVVAELIVNRGIRSYEDAQAFLTPKIEELASPFDITGVREAVDCLLRHVALGSKVAVYGDYDVDGVMSAVILQKSLNTVGADCFYYVPDRETEGYGLNERAVFSMRDTGVSLIVACDNGISAIEEAELIYDCGMELIIIDHHEPIQDEKRADVIPRAEAVINPKIANCNYVFKEMCAAGLCYRFALALFKETESLNDELDDLLVFAALATVCDVVDLMGDNRIIVRSALDRIFSTKNKGLRALLNIYELKKVGTYHIGFILGPAINAAGRLDSAEIATRLFMTEDDEEAKKNAQRLYELNLNRRELTEVAYKRLSEAVSDEVKIDKVCVLYDKDINESVSGIVAGRLKEKFFRPMIVITDGKECAKGSARSIESYNMFEALSEVSNLFIKFGGHSQAAGFALPSENVDKLRRLLNKHCCLDEEDFIPKLHIEMRLPLEKITMELSRSLEALEPFGKGNKEPVFAEKAVKFKKVEFIGKERSVARLLLLEFPELSVISFNGIERLLAVLKDKVGTDDKDMLSNISPFEMDIAFTLNVNEFRGEKSIQLVLKDFR